MNTKHTGYIYLALAMLSAGSTVIASKVIAAHIPPFSATAIRFAIALPIFAWLMYFTKTPWPVLDRKEWSVLLLQAAAGSVGYTTLLISGLHFASAADAAMIIGTLPVVSTCIAIVVLREKPGIHLLLAVLLASAGVLAISFRLDADAHSLLGNVLIMGAVVCEGVFILLNKRLSRPLHPLALSTLITLLGFLLALLPALFEPVAVNAGMAPAAWALLYYAVIPTVGGFLCWYAGAKRVSGTEASVFTAIAPIAAMAFAALLLHETIGLLHILGVSCVLASLMLLLIFA